MPNRIPDRRWQVISVDLIVELPESRGYNAIMVVVDRLSKRAHLIPTTNEVDSIGIARLFRDHVWKLHGIPEEVISDRGPQFVSQFMHELSKFLDIKIAASTTFHPQTDGQTERVNQEIEQYLRVFVNQCQDDWYDWLALVEFSYNDRIHASTQHKIGNRILLQYSASRYCKKSLTMSLAQNTLLNIQNIFHSIFVHLHGEEHSEYHHDAFTVFCGINLFQHQGIQNTIKVSSYENTEKNTLNIQQSILG
jgi:hypothetical protein